MSHYTLLVASAGKIEVAQAQLFCHHALLELLHALELFVLPPLIVSGLPMKAAKSRVAGE